MICIHCIVVDRVLVPVLYLDVPSANTVDAYDMTFVRLG